MVRSKPCNRTGGDGPAHGQILVLFHCLHSMHSLASVSSLPACFSAHTLSGIRFSLRHILPRSFPLVGRLALFLSPAAGLSSPAAGLFSPRRQDFFLPGSRTLTSPAAGLSPPRRQDSHLPGGRTFSSPAAGLFPPRGRTLTSPAEGLSPCPLSALFWFWPSTHNSAALALTLGSSLALTLALAVPFSWRPRPFSAATSFRCLILVVKAWSGYLCSFPPHPTLINCRNIIIIIAQPVFTPIYASYLINYKMALAAPSSSGF